jgi:hypothetical protein
MGVALAPYVGRPEQAAANDVIVFMNRVTDWCSAAHNLDDLLDAQEKARCIREMAKVRKMATEVLIATTRAELAILRRLGQLKGGPESFKGSQFRSAARYLGAMPEEKFNAVSAGLDTAASAVSIVQQLKAEERERDSFAELNRMYEGAGRVVAFREYDLERITAAAIELLGVFETDEFTVLEAAQTLLEKLEVHHYSILELEAAKAIVSHALLSASHEQDYSLFDGPRFVTFSHDEFGWRRIASSQASVGQFRQMVELRESQAEALTAKALHLRRILNATDGAADATRLFDALGYKRKAKQAA